jgi:hypothetical protein
VVPAENQRQTRLWMLLLRHDESRKPGAIGALLCFALATLLWLAGCAEAPGGLYFDSSEEWSVCLPPHREAEGSSTVLNLGDPDPVFQGQVWTTLGIRFIETDGIAITGAWLVPPEGAGQGFALPPTSDQPSNLLSGWEHRQPLEGGTVSDPENTWLLLQLTLGPGLSEGNARGFVLDYSDQLGRRFSTRLEGGSYDVTDDCLSRP